MSGLSELKVALDTEPFSEKMGLFLKHLAKAEITVKLPKITVPGQSISNWDLMERLKKIVHPIQFDAIKVQESTLEGVIFETELLSKAMLRQAIKILEGQTMKVSGFSEPLKISIKEAKSDFPSRHDWDLFFLKNNVEEAKPGERPDTIYLAKVPAKWFNDGKLDGPSELLLQKAMSSFGAIRRVDIPCCDPMRKLINQKISGYQQKGFSFGQELLFEAYVQYEDYSGFEAAMNALRNMKWIKKIDEKTFQANVKVDFDRTRHLSDAVIARRDAEKGRLIAEKRRELQAEEDAKLAEEQRKRLAELEKLRRQEEREQKRRQKRDEERRKEEERKKKEEERKARELAEKEAERKLKQQTILQSQRLLECVFTRIEAKENRKKLEAEEQLMQRKREIEKLDGEAKEAALRDLLLYQREQKLRAALLEKMAVKAKEKKEAPVEPKKEPKEEEGVEKSTSSGRSSRSERHRKHSGSHKHRKHKKRKSESREESRSRSRSRGHRKKRKKSHHKSR